MASSSQETEHTIHLTEREFIIVPREEVEKILTSLGIAFLGMPDGGLEITFSISQFAELFAHISEVDNRVFQVEKKVGSKVKIPEVDPQKARYISKEEANEVRSQINKSPVARAAVRDAMGEWGGSSLGSRGLPQEIVALIVQAEDYRQFLSLARQAEMKVFNSAKHNEIHYRKVSRQRMPDSLLNAPDYLKLPNIDGFGETKFLYLKQIIHHCLLEV